MFGWFNDARMRASRSKRVRRLVVDRECSRQNFDRDVPSEPGIARPVDLSHSAYSDETQDGVCTEVATHLF
jgi:hypothetical protein